MIIRKPYIRLIRQEGRIDGTKEHIVRCARLCMGELCRFKDNDEAFEYLVNEKLKNILQHGTYYAMTSDEDDDLYAEKLKECEHNPCSDWLYDEDINYFAYDGSIDILDIVPKNEIVSVDDFEQRGDISFNMVRRTFQIATRYATAMKLKSLVPDNVTVSGLTNEFALADEMTAPYWMDDYVIERFEKGEEEELAEGIRAYYRFCEQSFDNYKTLMRGDYFPEEVARNILTGDATAILLITCSPYQYWKLLNDIRNSDEHDGDLLVVANMIESEMEKLGYEMSTEDGL